MITPEDVIERLNNDGLSYHEDVVTIHIYDMQYMVVADNGHNRLTYNIYDDCLLMNLPRNLVSMDNFKDEWNKRVNVNLLMSKV